MDDAKHSRIDSGVKSKKLASCKYPFEIKTSSTRLMICCISLVLLKFIEESITINMRTDEYKPAPPVKKRRTFKEDPFDFIDETDERWKDIANYYGISENFPNDCLFGRVADLEKRRTLYFANDNVKKFIQCNQNKVKVINAGVRMFGRVEHKFQECRFRMCQDGVRMVLPFISKRLIYVTEEDMYNILKGEQSCTRESLICCESLDGITSGSVIFVHKSDDGALHVVCTWMGAKLVTAYASKEERIHIIRMLDRDSSELENTLPSVRQQKAVRERQLNAISCLSGSREKKSTEDESVSDKNNAVPEND